MPKQKRRTLPGVVMIIALIVLAIALGVYGNKVVPGVSSGTETGVTQTVSKVPTTTETKTSATTIPVGGYTNTTITKAP